jgi:hypothetical protein
MHVYDWIDVYVSGNTIIRNTDPAIYLRSCQKARIIGNHVRDHNALTGAILVIKVDAVQPQDTIIHGNTVTNTTGYGIRVSDLDTGSVVANIIRNYDTALAARVGISFDATCKNIAVVANTVVGGGGDGGVTGGGNPIDIAAACTRMLCVANICQEIGDTTAGDSAIDNDAASTIHAFNCDEQRSTYPFTSHSGMTPLGGSAVGLSSTARKSTYEVTVAAGAGAGTVSTTSNFIQLNPIVNVIWAAMNVAAAAMVGTAVGVYCARTATGFDLVHNGNPAGTDALFMCQAVST